MAEEKWRVTEERNAFGRFSLQHKMADDKGWSLPYATAEERMYLFELRDYLNGLESRLAAAVAENERLKVEVERLGEPLLFVHVRERLESERDAVVARAERAEAALKAIRDSEMYASDFAGAPEFRAARAALTEGKVG